MFRNILLAVVAMLGIVGCCASAFAGDSGPVTIPVALDFERPVSLRELPAITVQVQDPEPPQVWSASLYWDIRGGKTCAVAVRTIGTIYRPLGMRFDLTGDVFGGTTFEGEILAGAAVSGSLSLAQNVQLKLGVGTNWRFNTPIKDAGIGLLIGLNWRL
jgi:hypothetical protein